MLPSLQASLADDLAAIKARSAYRTFFPIDAGTSTHPYVAQRPLVSFCSNDYLGLAHHPALAASAASVAGTQGFGATASRLVCGTRPAVVDLEASLATFLALPAALVFPTGYQANIGLITALAGPQDLIVSDAANHASLIDGCRLSRATVRIYPHRDKQAARVHLQGSASFRRRFLLTESLFSMDGDAAPLSDLAEIAARSDAALLVDEAHACGVLGPGGRGLCAAAGVKPDALVGTLGKAFGAAGGFVAGTTELHATLINRSRTFIFTTALPAPVAAAATAALGLASGVEGDARRATLASHVQALNSVQNSSDRFPISGPIFPFILGSNQKALWAAAALRETGVLVQAIRPPTVAEGTARLRITLSAAHSSMDIALLLAALSRLDIKSG